MLIIPFYEKTDWKHIPIITLLLIVSNVLIYNFVQNDSRKSYTEAAQYYFSSKLYQYEFPLYLKHLGKTRPVLRERLKLHYHSFRRSSFLFKTLLTDQDFNQKLDSGQLITPNHKHYATWHRKRSHYTKLRSRITSLNYGITPAYNSLTAAFTYMFLHGSKGHLIGNMIFLFVLGMALEKALGKLLFGLAYLSSGILSAEFFALINSSVTTPTIGASGAISGLMGLFTVIFGMRKINFFYWIVFYFDYVRAPAIALLPVWIGHELYQMLSNGASNVNYMVHLGGLLAGAMIALVYRLSKANVNNEFIDLEQREEQCKVTLNQAMQAMAKLDSAKAASLFRTLHKNNPDDINILEQYHAVLSHLPVNDAYHSTSLKLLAIPAANMQHAQTLLQQYKYYLSRTGGSAKLGMEIAVQLAKSFTRFGLLHEAETIVSTILQHRPELTLLPELLMALANAFYKLNQEDKQIKILTILSKQYPHTDEASTAEKLLREKPLSEFIGTQGH